MAQPQTSLYPRLPTRSGLKAALIWDYLLRFHMLLIVSLGFAAGLLATKLLLALGVETMWLRYLIAMLLAYGMFLLGIRIWLTYTGYSRHLRKNEFDGSFDFPDFSGGSNASGCTPDIVAGGGEFGGGGASAAFDTSAVEVPSQSFPDLSVNASDAGEAVGAIASDESGFLLVVAGGAVLAVAALILGAGIYVIYEAPNIFTEVVFEAMLAERLLKLARNAEAGGWMQGVLRVTWKPFLILFMVAVLLGWLVQHIYPESRTLLDFLHHVNS